MRWILLLGIMTLMPLAADARGDFADSTCEDMCAAQQYEEALACVQGRYDSSVDKIKHFGDSSIVVSTCAYQNGDFEVAEQLASMSIVKHPIAATIMKFAPKKGGAAHRQFLIELALEAQGKDASSAKATGIEYARNSGQCEGADDIETDDDGKTELQRCAEGYRDNVRYHAGEVTGSGGGQLTDPEKILESFALICGAHQEFSIEKLQCECSTGYRPEIKGSNTCILNIPRTYDAESVIAFEEKVEALAPNTYAQIDILDGSNTRRTVGVVKQVTGVPLFTLNGKDYHRDLSALLQPSMWSRVSRTWGSVTSAINPLNWFHVKEKEPGKELAWQVARETLTDFEGEAKRLAQQYDLFQAELKKYNNYKGWADAIIAKYVEAGKIIADAEGYATDLLVGTLKTFGETLPGEAFVKFVDEAKIETFADPAWFYISRREEGESQSVIRDNDYAELDVFVSTNVRDTFGEGLYDRLEEVYQRWLLAKEFGRKE